MTPNNPVFVNRLDGHMGLANSAALRAAGIVARDQGHPRRRHRARSRARASRPASSRTARWTRWSGRSPLRRTPSATRRSDARWPTRRSKGVTAFAHVSVDPADLGTYLRAKAAGALTARAALYFPLETWHAVADTIARLGRGDDWVWIGGVKGYVDGSLGSTTALFYAPYDDDPDDVRACW